MGFLRLRCGAIIRNHIPRNKRMIGKNWLSPPLGAAA
jgi:hypothetical protein